MSVDDLDASSENLNFLELKSEGISPNEVESGEDEIFAHGRAKGNVHLANSAKEIYEEVNVRIL